MKKPVGLCLLLVVNLVALILVACQSLAPKSEPESTAALTVQSQTGAPTAASAGGGDVDSSPSVTPASSSGPTEELPTASLPESFRAMLAKLGNYRIALRLSFDGQDAGGTPVAFELEAAETVASNPPRSRLDLSTVGGSAPGQVESMSMLHVEDAVYLYLPQIGCISGDVGEFGADMRLPVDPEDVLEGLSDAQLATNTVVVNGMNTAEFRFDESSLSWMSGRPWVVDGTAFVEEGSDFVTQVNITLLGRGDLLDDGRTLDGTYEIVIDIMPASGQETLIMPDACRESARYPLPPDASDITAIEELLTFRSHLTPAEVVDFYMSQMPTAGWLPSSEAELFDDLAIMNFAQDDLLLMITVEQDDGADTVTVLISR